MQIPLSDVGLNLLLLEPIQRELKHEAYSDFETFLDYHALQAIKQRHNDQGLPTEQIIEYYYRFCKARRCDVVIRCTAVSDEKGLVQFDESSSGDYLLNSVLVLEPDAPPAHWTTLWTSLFYQQTEQ